MKYLSFSLSRARALRGLKSLRWWIRKSHICSDTIGALAQTHRALQKKLIITFYEMIYEMSWGFAFKMLTFQMKKMPVPANQSTFQWLNRVRVPMCVHRSLRLRSVSSVHLNSEFKFLYECRRKTCEISQFLSGRFMATRVRRFSTSPLCGGACWVTF